MATRVLLLLGLQLISLGLIAQEVNNQETHQYKIIKVDQTINIDGKLDEPIWNELESMGDMTYSFPVDDEMVEEAYQTVVKLCYDDKNIYVSAICKGPGPYVIPSLKRDNNQFWDGDVFSISFDPVNERNLGIGFGTNPSGVQFDVLFSANTGTRTGGGGGGFNVAWDTKWESNSTYYNDHWVAEMAIPFKALKYSDRKIWGVNIIRGVPETNSWHTWAPVPRQLTGVDLGFTGALHWDEAPPKATGNISLIPYALGSSFKDFEDNTPTEYKYNLGADAKIAINSNLNLDLTFNPDFSQVDVDVQQTNLTTTNIRFPERRLFFLENADIFSEFGVPPMRPFFSRKIGLDEDGSVIPILYGARLTGNLTKDLRIGIMNLQTRANDVFNSQNYSNISFNQRIFGRTIVRGFFQNRQAYVNNEFSGVDYNRSLGLELEYRSLNGAFRSVLGSGLNLTEGVENKNHTYHGIISYNNPNLSFYTNLMEIGDNYIPDMGFMTWLFHYDAVTEETHRLGYIHDFTRFSYTFYPENSEKIVSHGIGFRNVFDITTESNELFIYRFTPLYNIGFANTSQFEITFNEQYTKLLYPFAFTSEEPLPAGKYRYRFVGASYDSDFRKTLSYSLGFEYGTFFNGDRIQFSGELRYRRQPWGNFSLAFEQNELNFPDPHGSTSLTLLGPKIEFNFSRDFFWTTFIQYNTQADNFNINSRLQWQFKPLSNIFLVYSDNYFIENWGPKNRALVLKMNYWLTL